MSLADCEISPETITIGIDSRSSFDLASCWIKASILIFLSANTEDILAITPVSSLTWSLKYLETVSGSDTSNLLSELGLISKSHPPLAISTKSAITAEAVGSGPAPGP